VDFNELDPSSFVSAVAALIGAIAAFVSAIFAGIAVRTQRTSTIAHVQVKNTTSIPVATPVPGTFRGASFAESPSCRGMRRSGQRASLSYSVASGRVTSGPERQP